MAQYAIEVIEEQIRASDIEDEELEDELEEENNEDDAEEEKDEETSEKIPEGEPSDPDAADDDLVVRSRLSQYKRFKSLAHRRLVY